MLTIPVERSSEASSASGLPIAAGVTPSARKSASRFVDQRNRDDFVIAQGDQAFAQTILRFGVRQARAGSFAGGRRGGNFS